MLLSYLLICYATFGIFIVVYIYFLYTKKKLNESKKELVTTLKMKILLLRSIRDFLLLKKKIEEKEREIKKMSL